MLRRWAADILASLAILLFLVFGYYFLFHHEQYHERLDWFLANHPGPTAALALVVVALYVGDLRDPTVSESAKMKAVVCVGIFGLASLFFLSKALHVL